MNTEKKLNKIKAKSKKFAEEIKNDIYSLCENLDYTNSSRFSYNIDRIEHFLKELTDFEILTNQNK